MRVRFPEVFPREWLLLLFDGTTQPLDRIRIQKAMFLFAQRSKAPDDQKYIFKPYHYGPFSGAIYPDLDGLAQEGLLRGEAGPMASPIYTLTPAGRIAAAALREKLPADRIQFLHDLRNWVMERPFRQLLTDIYRLYPDFAVNSIFR